MIASSILSAEFLQLRDLGFVKALKTETESEGLDWDSITFLRVLCAKMQLPFHLKIGGCEAISDIVKSQYLDVDSVIAPMVENAFSAAKFKNGLIKSQTALSRGKLLIETVAGVESLDEIVSENIDWITGINFGRSDLLGSLESRFKTKSSFGSPDFVNLLETGLRTSKEYGLETTVGGKMTENNLKFLLNLNPDVQPDNVETRRFVLDFSFLKSKPELLSNVLRFEYEIVEKLFQMSSIKNQNLGVYLGELHSRLDPVRTEFNVL